MAPEHIDVAVLGPGGVGGLIAALLARQGNSVEVIAGDQTSRAIAERGLRVESSMFGDFSVPVAAATRLTKRVDACFITVKATQLGEALAGVPANVLGDGLVIPLLNGIDHVELLRTIYPPGSVVAATIGVETARVEPGLIRQTSPFALVEMAASPTNRDRVKRVAEQLKAAGLSVRVREDETAMLWDKLVMLAPLALLTTHERAGVGVVRTQRRQDAIAVITEVAAVGQAEGATRDAETVLRMLDSTPEAMGSSMQRDQAAGRPLELDAIGGVVLRHAASRGIPVPATTRLVQELKARGLGSAPGA
ncbi:MAG: ketopantoate reductase family protein [Candidatus Dormibacteraceae bacterium]